MAKTRDQDEHSFDAWAGLFQTSLRAEKRASQYTDRNYMATLTRFGAFLQRRFGEAPDLPQLQVLEAKDFRAFLAERRDDGLQPQSLKLELSAIKSFYAFLRKRAGIENDAIEIMREPESQGTSAASGVSR